MIDCSFFSSTCKLIKTANLKVLGYPYCEDLWPKCGETGPCNLCPCNDVGLGIEKELEHEMEQSQRSHPS